MSHSDSNKSVPVTVSMPPDQKAQVKERAAERSMSMSDYVRVHMMAGEKQLLAVEEELEGSNDLALEEQVLSAVSTDPDNALSHEEILEQVLEEVETQVFEILDTDDRITHSAAQGGYYIK